MNNAHADFRRCLESGDVDGLRAAWAAVMPELPQPETREQAEIVMHRARTEAECLPLRARAYSHRWLTERLLPSGLPDHLKPGAERLYPRVVDAVGVSINFRSRLLKPASRIVERSMCDAVEDAYAAGRKEPAFVKARMTEARDRTIKALFGRLPGKA